jgi:L-ascorbate metabolism protein UlaG (beta-lactamase superfamily)
MEITWWGTASFRISTDKNVFLIDPYLSRNPAARPLQPLGPADVTDGDQIFLSHGHFDHVYDVPAMASRIGSAVYCSGLTADNLVRAGLKPDQVHAVPYDNFTCNFNGYRAQAFFSRHVRFDLRLILRTLARINFRLFRYRPLQRNYPAGQVLSWRFIIDGFAVHHFGSAGSSEEELAKIAQQHTDLLLVPLQGHTRICDIALKYVDILQPDLVIPNHQDDFYPPISMEVDIDPFVKGVGKKCPNTEVRVMALNETITL